MPMFLQLDLMQVILFSVLGVLFLVALFIAVVAMGKAKRLEKQYRKLMGGREGKDIEDLLLEALDKVRASVYQLEDMQTALRSLIKQADGALQKVGVVRFNPFEDTGSDLSFAVAMLDVQGNGIILTSLFGRDESRTYAKPVVNGSSPYQLSKEEIEAIAQALK